MNSLTSDVACVYILTRDDWKNWQQQHDAKIGHISNRLESRQMNAENDKCSWQVLHSLCACEPNDRVK